MASLSHRQGWSFTVLLTIFPCVFFASTTNDAPSAIYRTGASEVRIAFFATDDKNHLVESIDRNDFAVVDGDAVIRDFRSLTRSGETPLDIVLLVDASESVAPRYQAVTQFISDRPAAGARQVLIIFSDGEDTISGTTPQDALESLAATGAVLYTVDVHASRRESSGKYWLQQMAESTGGRALSFQDGEASILQAVLTDMRASYVVTYQLPRRTAGFHSLRILPKHNLNLRFHCRRGYFYEDNR